jgi:arginase family enzyme
MFFEFFSPFDDSENESLYQPTQIGASILKFDGRNLDVQEYDIAIIGVPDDRGSRNNMGNDKAPDAIRE